ncbi:MAG: DUF2087 domain-containing protein [Candidatus Zixiibacteriota bacterium]
MESSSGATIADRLRSLLLRQEVVVGNLKRDDLWVVVAAAASAIPKGESLNEKDVTERLTRWLGRVGENVRMDSVELRRLLVDYRCLVRDAAGREYQRPAEWPDALKETARGLEGMDIESFADQARAEELERRAARKKAALEKKEGTTS